ncbi:MAG: hypothetical protein KAU03_05735 [Candidatus Altiarchaeales archaeon]|nr:hypothetical protein [Candidatus Altiarchaeales archaeon]
MGHKWVINKGYPFRVTSYGPGDRILDLIKPEGEIDLKELGLNERQIEALRLMVNEKGEFTNRGYREKFEVTNKTAATDLNQLVAKGLILQVGKGRSIRYKAV